MRNYSFYFFNYNYITVYKFKFSPHKIKKKFFVNQDLFNIPITKKYLGKSQQILFIKCRNKTEKLRKE